MGGSKGHTLELECAHCGDMVVVPKTGGVELSCPSCGESFDLPHAPGTDESIEKKDTARVPRQRRRG